MICQGGPWVPLKQAVGYGGFVDCQGVQKMVRKKARRPRVG
jgi:hypothetical protein